MVSSPHPTSKNTHFKKRTTLQINTPYPSGRGSCKCRCGFRRSPLARDRGRGRVAHSGLQYIVKSDVKQSVSTSEVRARNSYLLHWKNQRMSECERKRYAFQATSEIALRSTNCQIAHESNIDQQPKSYVIRNFLI